MSRVFHRGPKALSMGYQSLVLKKHCETISSKVTSPSHLEWVGMIHPAPYCEQYRVHLDYRTDTRNRPRPVITIRGPLLQKRDGKGCPHRYGEQQPCLYHPPSNEWMPNMPLAFTIVPWASRWLYYYEIWLTTGEWHGGGIEHAPS
jgi:hypothetical protein